MRTTKKPMLVLGWREWVALPDLGIRRLKAKLDTGARSSAVHADDVERFRHRGQDWVRFHVVTDTVHRVRRVPGEARLLDERVVRSSGGHESHRYVIDTHLEIAGWQWPIELTLAERPSMSFRMLIGRQALSGHVLIDSSHSYLAGRPPRRRRGTA